MLVKTPMYQTRNGYLRSEGKAVFLVQRGRSCKTSLFSDAFRLTFVNFFREFYKSTPNAYIYKALLAAFAGPMTVTAWLDLRTGIGKAVKNFKISSENFLGKVRNIFGSHGFS